MKEAKNKFAELGRRAEAGETIVVSRHGKPAFQLVPSVKKSGIGHKAARRFLDKHGIKDPLPEDFLLKRLPEKA